MGSTPQMLLHAGIKRQGFGLGNARRPSSGQMQERQSRLRAHMAFEEADEVGGDRQGIQLLLVSWRHGPHEP